MWDDTVYTTQGTYIKAVQWTGGNFARIVMFVQSSPNFPYVDTRGDCLRIFGQEETGLLHPGDWLIRTLQGELVACPKKLFALVFISPEKAPVPC
jgi:hypothetical protein